MAVVLSDRGCGGFSVLDRWRGNALRHLPLLVVLMGALLVGCVGYLMARGLERERTEVLRGAETDASNLARAFEGQIFQTVRRLDQALIHLRDEYEHDSADFELRAREWQSSVYVDLAFQIGVIGADGLLMFSNLARPAERTDLSDREHFKAVRDTLDDRMFISRPVLGRVSGKWSIQFVRRLRAPGGGFGGALVLSLDPGQLSRFYETVNVGRDGVVTLVGTDRVIRARASGAPSPQNSDQPAGSQPGAVPQTYIGTELPANRPFFRDGAPSSGIFRLGTSIDGVARITAYRRLKDYPLVVHVLLGEREILASFERRREEVVTSGVAIGLFILAVTVVMAWLVQIQNRHRRRLEAAQEQLAESEERWRLALEAVGDGVWDWNAETGDVFFSSGWKSMLGYAEDEIAHRLGEWENRIHPDDRASVNADVERHFRGASAFYRNEHRVRCRDGSYKWILDRGVVVRRRPDGTPLRMVGTHTDVTDRKKAEMKLEANLRFQRTLIDTVPIPIFVKDRDRRYIDANAAFLRWSGLSRAALVGSTVECIAAPELAETYSAADAALLADPHEQVYEARLRNADGVETDVEFSKAVFFDAAGAPSGIVGAIVDLSAHKQAELALRDRQEFFEQIFVGSRAVKLLTDPSSGAIVDANPAAAEFYGHSLDTLRAMRMADIAVMSDDEVLREMERVLLDGHDHFHIRHRLASGRVRDMEVYSSPIVVGGRTLLLSLLHDVTDRRHAEEELQVQTAELNRSNAELEAFAYAASHDLRQPLRSITSYLTLLEQDIGAALDADCREYLDFARDGARRMDRLIVDLLEYSRVGRKTKPFAACPVTEILETALLNMKAAVDEAGAEIQVPPALPVLWGDDNELMRLFQNLIGNAVKYRAPDRAPVVRIGCAVEGGGFWHFTVADNGIGIASEHLERVFGIFQRLHTRDRYEGTGIGLAICRKIVEHHRGRIWAESEAGQGCVFHVLLPRGEGMAA